MKENHIKSLEGIPSMVLPELEKTLGAEKYFKDGKYDVEAYLSDLENDRLEKSKVNSRENHIQNVNSGRGEILLNTEEENFGVVAEKQHYVINLKIRKGNEEMTVGIPDHNTSLLFTDIKKIFDLAVDLLKGDLTLKEVADQINDYISMALLADERMCYSREIKLSPDKSHYEIVDPKTGESIAVYQTAYAGPHYLQGESKDGKRSVTIYNRWNDDDLENIELDSESVQWSDK